MSVHSSRAKLTRQCQQCGADFQTWPSVIRNGGGKFCSHPCYAANNKANTARQKGNCLTCGKAIEVLASRAARGWGVYCSDKCHRAGRVTQVDFVCVTCKKVFKVVAHRESTVQTCSKACHHAHLRTLPIPTLEERFWEKVQKAGECWVWMGATSEFSYGILARTKRDHPGKGASKIVFAHRLSYEMHNGPVAGFHVLHRCDNPLCVNPVHLFLGTHSDNMRDKTIKGRAAKKLTADDVRSIRTRYANSEATQKGLASEFSVSLTCIVNVLKRNTFKHVD